MAPLTYVYLFAVFFISDSFQASEYLPCGGNLPAPLSLRIKDCDHLPCNFKRGTDVVAEWDFAVAADTATLKPLVKVTVLGSTINYPLPEQNACKSLVNGECPLDAGEEATYGLRMPIQKIYPKISLGIEFQLVDEHGTSLSCFKINGKVVDA